MKALEMLMTTHVCCSVLIASLCCASAPAQVLSPPTEEEAAPKTVPMPSEEEQPRKNSLTDPATDEWPEKRNPFWPIHLQQSTPASAVTNGTGVRITPPPTEVDWKDAMKYVRDNAKVSIVAGKILVAIDGQIYEIGQTLSVTCGENIYVFKVKEGAKLEPQGVRHTNN
jgi:hypothetical protein